MPSTALKNRIMRRIQSEEDATVLKAIDILLREDSKEAAIRRRMTEMAILSEEAIRTGEVMSFAEARKRTKSLLKEIAEARTKTKRA